MKEKYTFQDLLGIMELLRSEKGCPWDRKQTHETLTQNMLEESYEVVDAVKNKDKENLCEELGDVLLQVIFNAQIAKENDDFDIDDVINVLSKKLVHRHPHVFGDKEADNEKQAKQNWDNIKKQEKKVESYTQDMQRIAKSLPALIRASKVQKKAANVGFDWDNVEDAMEKVKEEVIELKQAYNNRDDKGILEEYGDILFSMVNISRFFQINPEFALTNAIEKFINRFRYIEYFASKSGKALDQMTFEEMNILWDKAKSCTK